MSAGLLILAFPKTDIWFTAWFGLVPLMFALDGKNPFQAFRTAYFCGVLFFACMLYGFVHVTVLGAISSVLYLSCYFGMFGLAYSYFSNRKPVLKLFLLPGYWVVLEFIRAHLVSGFDWVSMGQSQYKVLTVIQIADITGMYGVSFFVVMVNVFLKEVLPSIFLKLPGHWNPGSKKILLPEMMRMIFVAVGLVVIVIGYGLFRLNYLNNSRQLPEEKVSIVVIQANIPQEIKWQETALPVIIDKYLALSKEAVKDFLDFSGNVDALTEENHRILLVWPETSFPGFLWEDEGLLAEIKDFVVRSGVPLLFGSIIHEENFYYNSAVLMGADGEILEKYNKIHLVPFGEYLPLRKMLPFLSGIIPIEDFSSGENYTVFPLKKGEASVFSVLICFEDTVSRLSRGFVDNGAKLLINITNDGWFKDSKVPFLHLQSAVFRAVENRRSLVRAANTGVSCFIDLSGKILNYVEDDKTGKKLYVQGHAIETVYLNSGRTFYTRFGEIFVYLCIAFVGGFVKGRFRIFPKIQ